MDVKNAAGDTPLAKAAQDVLGMGDGGLKQFTGESGPAAPAITAVKAKMTCHAIDRRQYPGGETVKVQLGVVYGNKGENADFTSATPSGECWMQIDAGRPASAFFKPGKTYYMTFTEAPD